MPDNDIDILARTLYGEAKPNCVEDAQSIACVVLNRLAAHRYGNTIAGVCQKPKQFSCWNPGDINLTRIKKVTTEDKWFARCLEISELAVKHSLPDVTNGATHYHTRTVHPSWSADKIPCHETPGHIYFNDIDAPRTARRAVHTAVMGGAAATGATFAAGQMINQVAPAFPLMGQIVQYAPLLFGFVMTLGVLFIAYKFYKKE